MSISRYSKLNSNSLLSFFRREIQSLIHPQKYVRLLKLTDGSSIRVSTLTPPTSTTSNAPFTVSLLNLDSTNHPSWNPELRDRLLLNDRGQVAKFRAKFEKNLSNESGNEIDFNLNSNENEKLKASNDGTDYAAFLEMDPNLSTMENGNTLTKAKKPKIVVKNGAKKKK